MWEIVHYQKPDGECPVADFIRSLDAEEQVQVNSKVRSLASLGHELRRPHADFLEDGIYELRIKTRYGQLRLLYFFYKRVIIVLTHGFHKKSDEVPPSEIKKAKQYREDYVSRH